MWADDWTYHSSKRFLLQIVRNIIGIQILLGYLVLVDSNMVASKDSWIGETMSIRLKSAETIIAITQIKVKKTR